MRSHPSEKTEKAETSGTILTTNDCLQDAIDWFVKYDIPLYGVNDNPSQHSWTDSNKVLPICILMIQHWAFRWCIMI